MSEKIGTRIVLACAVVAALAVSGCGRKAPLDVPTAKPVETAPATNDSPIPAESQIDTPEEPATSSNGFILDALIR